MKIAVPVKMKSENPAVAPLFGKAKWFAFIENEKIEIVPNACSGGKAVIDWLYSQNITTLFIQEMGQTPYDKIKEYGSIEVYHTGFERMLLLDSLSVFKKGGLMKLDDDNMKTVIEHHQKRHPAH